MTFTVFIVSIEQNEEFQQSRVHYTFAGIKSLLKIGEGGFLDARGGVPEPLEPSPGYAPARGKQRPVVHRQTDLFPGSPRVLFVKTVDEPLSPSTNQN